MSLQENFVRLNPENILTVTLIGVAVYGALVALDFGWRKYLAA